MLRRYPDSALLLRRGEAKGDHFWGWRPIAVAVVALFVAGCGVGGSGDAHQTVDVVLPFGIGKVSLYLQSAELLKLRPNVSFDSSTGSYVEQLPAEGLMAPRIEYRFEHQRLVEILIGQEWQLDSGARELPELIPMILKTLEQTWGRPDYAGEFTKKYGGTFRFVLLVWNRAGATILAHYPSVDSVKEAIGARNHAVPIGFSITVLDKQMGKRRLAAIQVGS